MRRFLSYYNCGLYKKLTSANITSHDGEHNGTQFRPFIDASGSLASFAIKFSSYAQKSTIKRTSLKRLNQAYNSSSGNSTSIIFDCRKEITPIMLSFGKNKLTTDKKTIDEYVSGLYINGSALSDQEVLSKISEQIQGKMLSISGYFEEFFFEQSWSELYDKFVLSQTYFDN